MISNSFLILTIRAYAIMCPENPLIKDQTLNRSNNTKKSWDQGPSVPHLPRQVLKLGRIGARAWGSPPVSGRLWNTEFHTGDP